VFEINTPPNADVGSQAKAVVRVTYRFSCSKATALCFNMAKVAVSFEFIIKVTAASTSSKLLYDNSFP
jgi:hypothetical protein